MDNNFGLSDFLDLDIDDINLSIPTIHDSILKTTYEINLKIKLFGIDHKVDKRYTEFEGLHDSLTFRYKNINFQELPSKFQLFGKKETRRKFFEDFLNFILQICQKHDSIKKDLLKIVYDFIFSDVIATKEKSKKKGSFSPVSTVSKSMKKLSFDIPNNTDSGNDSNVRFNDNDFNINV